LRGGKRNPTGEKRGGFGAKEQWLGQPCGVQKKELKRGDDSGKLKKTGKGNPNLVRLPAWANVTQRKNVSPKGKGGSKEKKGDM